VFGTDVGTTAINASAIGVWTSRNIARQTVRGITRRAVMIRQKPSGRQDVVVCKIPTAGACGVEVLPKSRLALELSCCLQDRSGAVSGRECAAGNSARRRPGAGCGIAANSPDCGTAIFAGCPGTLGDIPGQSRSSDGDIRRGGGAGNQGRCTPTAPVGISMAGRSAHRRGIAVRPYHRLSHPAESDAQGGRFRNCYIVRTASWLMAGFSRAIRTCIGEAVNSRAAAPPNRFRTLPPELGAFPVSGAGPIVPRRPMGHRRQVNRRERI
jgi:hypothetical protein